MFSKLLLLAGLGASLTTASHMTRGNPHHHHRHPARQAMGNVIINNKCGYDLWMWSVDQDTGSSAAIPFPAGSPAHTEPIRATSAGGIVFKVSATDSIVAGKHTQLEYTIGGNQVWYDISFVDCAVGDSASNCPGHDGGIKITGSVGECAEMHCEAGSYCVTKAYYVDQPKIKLGVEEPVGTCAGAGTGVDIVFDICSDSPGTNGGLGRRGVAGRVKL